MDDGVQVGAGVFLIKPWMITVCWCIDVLCSAYFLADSYLKYVGWTLFDKASLSLCYSICKSCFVSC